MYKKVMFVCLYTKQCTRLNYNKLNSVNVILKYMITFSLVYIKKVLLQSCHFRYEIKLISKIDVVCFSKFCLFLNFKSASKLILKLNNSIKFKTILRTKLIFCHFAKLTYRKNLTCVYLQTYKYTFTKYLKKFKL